jgi:hypothetical protein
MEELQQVVRLGKKPQPMAGPLHPFRAIGRQAGRFHGIFLIGRSEAVPGWHQGMWSLSVSIFGSAHLGETENIGQGAFGDDPGTGRARRHGWPRLRRTELARLGPNWNGAAAFMAIAWMRPLAAKVISA